MILDLKGIDALHLHISYERCQVLQKLLTAVVVTVFLVLAIWAELL